MAVDLKLIFFSLVSFPFFYTTPCTFICYDIKTLDGFPFFVCFHVICYRCIFIHRFYIFLIVYTYIFLNASLLPISDYDFYDYDYYDYDYYGSFTTSYFFMNFIYHTSATTCICVSLRNDYDINDYDYGFVIMIMFMHIFILYNNESLL